MRLRCTLLDEHGTSWSLALKGMVFELGTAFLALQRGKRHFDHQARFSASEWALSKNHTLESWSLVPGTLVPMFTLDVHAARRILMNEKSDSS